MGQSGCKGPTGICRFLPVSDAVAGHLRSPGRLQGEVVCCRRVSMTCIKECKRRTADRKEEWNSVMERKFAAVGECEERERKRGSSHS